MKSIKDIIDEIGLHYGSAHKITKIINETLGITGTTDNSYHRVEYTAEEAATIVAYLQARNNTSVKVVVEKPKKTVHHRTKGAVSHNRERGLYPRITW